MKQTAVEYLIEELRNSIKGVVSDVKLHALIETALEMEETKATEYAEFCIRCDRAGLPLVKFEDWISDINF
jgi:hypothetical protein